MYLRHVVITAREEEEENKTNVEVKVSRAQLKQTLISNMVTSN